LPSGELINFRPTQAAAFSPDERYLANVIGNHLIIYEMPNQRIIRIYKIPLQTAPNQYDNFFIEFSPDGNNIFVGNNFSEQLLCFIVNLKSGEIINLDNLGNIGRAKIIILKKAIQNNWIVIVTEDLIGLYDIKQRCFDKKFNLHWDNHLESYSGGDKIFTFEGDILIINDFTSMKESRIYFKEYFRKIDFSNSSNDGSLFVRTRYDEKTKLHHIFIADSITGKKIFEFSSQQLVKYPAISNNKSFLAIACYYKFGIDNGKIFIYKIDTKKNAIVLNLKDAKKLRDYMKAIGY
jgi:WD40 repeat protein